ncbi:hypothetical protein N7519_002927 [Penicillium mononematosum]|uniref:uncharacterized protein n=1 Tax=Penicillium mononematosum TaxID=268346 RepID=UPI002548B8AB|nr:uncharacterized protein N7519_002927 [Penicillium mononematosum]KAJ6188019.1 hypothetical protein N7519_002927 [Penicillium mononematosum]
MASPFNRRPIPDYFIASPLVALLYPVHQILLRLRGPPRLPPPGTQPIRVVCISDTHTLEWPDVPDGDLLIHAGDLCNDGSARDIQAAVDWLRSLPHPYKVAIGGNHDSYFDVRSRLDEDRKGPASTGDSFSAVSSSTASIHSLHDLNGASRIDWAPARAPSPFTARRKSQPSSPFGPEHAFTYPPHHDAWSGTVPPETDILVTHTPPQSHLDLSPVYSTGCPNLLAESWRVRPALHVFGHVHESAGQEPIFWDEAQRAWERLCASRRSRARLSRLASLAGFLRDLFDLSAWMDAARVVGYGILGVVWAHVWGGENLNGGWMVNAACMYRDTGRLGNPPRVFTL